MATNTGTDLLNRRRGGGVPPRDKSPQPRDARHSSKLATGPFNTSVLSPVRMPVKPRKTNNPVLDLWFHAQWELRCGKQPTLLKDKQVTIVNYARERAPTTFAKLQNHIDTKTNIQNQAQQYDAGDWTDDEEDDVEDDFSVMVPSHTPDMPTTMSMDAATHSTAAQMTTEERRTSLRIERERIKKEKSVQYMWFKAQSQMKMGKNPTILRKYDYTMHDLRQYNPRFKAVASDRHSFRLGDLEDAVLTRARNSIASDRDEDEDDEEDDEDLPSCNVVVGMHYPGGAGAPSGASDRGSNTGSRQYGTPNITPYADPQMD